MSWYNKPIITGISITQKITIILVTIVNLLPGMNISIIKIILGDIPDVIIIFDTLDIAVASMSHEFNSAFVNTFNNFYTILINSRIPNPYSIINFSHNKAYINFLFNNIIKVITSFINTANKRRNRMNDIMHMYRVLQKFCYTR